MSLTVASCFLDLILSVIPARRSDLKYLRIVPEKEKRRKSIMRKDLRIS
jgi:hypothetical protein